MSYYALACFDAAFNLTCTEDSGRIDCEGVYGDIKEVSCIYDDRAETDEVLDTCKYSNSCAVFQHCNIFCIGEVQ